MLRINKRSLRFLFSVSILCTLLWLLMFFFSQPRSSEELIEYYANKYPKAFKNVAKSFEIGDNVDNIGSNHQHEKPIESSLNNKIHDQNAFRRYKLKTSNLTNSLHNRNSQLNPNVRQKTLIAQTNLYPNYYEDNLHPNWKFQISKTYDESLLRHWTHPKKLATKSNKWTQGENGKSFVPLNENDRELMDKLKKEHNYNIFASERISLHRSLPDYRFPECKKLVYPQKLPTVSVIIVIHNEAWSTLLRTIWSVIDRSPRELIEEIILVDDNSTWPSLKRPLDDYIEFIPVNIRILRTNRREGLIRARLMGAKNATGNVLTFFDAHVECTEGWLEPILARIASDRSVVVIPTIDAISSNDMNFHANREVHPFGLRWLLIFYWMDIPKRELLRTNYDKTAPIRTPSHIGCAFSVDREFFFEIGSYDEKMDIWGSENVELAFRVWMCGGSLEILPCSRIGHLFRISTYSFNGDATEIKKRNNVRVVEVWMDEFKDFFYAADPRSKTISPGDLTERKELRNRLQCRNFRWYLEHIFPESKWLKEYIMIGEIRSVSDNKCLDNNNAALGGPLITYNCHGIGGNQFFAFTQSGQIITDTDSCVGVNNKLVILVECSETESSQEWDYIRENHWIVHRQSHMCMLNNSTDVMIGKCDSQNHSEIQWKFKSFNS